MKVTLKYCRDLMERHRVSGSVLDGSDAVNPEMLKRCLLEANPESRFRVSLDAASYGQDDDDSWDLVGPGLPYGRVYYETKAEAEEDRDALNLILREHFGPNPRKVMYPSDAYKARCLFESACCPVCGSQKIVLEDYKFLNASCVIHRGCDDCNSDWEDVFALQGYQNVRMD